MDRRRPSFLPKVTDRIIGCSAATYRSADRHTQQRPLLPSPIHTRPRGSVFAVSSGKGILFFKYKTDRASVVGEDSASNNKSLGTTCLDGLTQRYGMIIHQASSTLPYLYILHRNGLPSHAPACCMSFYSHDTSTHHPRKPSTIQIATRGSQPDCNLFGVTRTSWFWDTSSTHR